MTANQSSLHENHCLEIGPRSIGIQLGKWRELYGIMLCVSSAVYRVDISVARTINFDR